MAYMHCRRFFLQRRSCFSLWGPQRFRTTAIVSPTKHIFGTCAMPVPLRTYEEGTYPYLPTAESAERVSSCAVTTENQYPPHLENPAIFYLQHLPQQPPFHNQCRAILAQRFIPVFLPTCMQDLGVSNNLVHNLSQARRSWSKSMLQQDVITYCCVEASSEQQLQEDMHWQQLMTQC